MAGVFFRRGYDVNLQYYCILKLARKTSRRCNYAKSGFLKIKKFYYALGGGFVKFRKCLSDKRYKSISKILNGVCILFIFAVPILGWAHYMALFLVFPLSWLISTGSASCGTGVLVQCLTVFSKPSVYFSSNYAWRMS